jgi:predicted ATPase/DNA-binding CsgD family transcriptional regulator
VSARRHNLPAPRIELIGREQDGAAVRALVLQAVGRIVTLTGPGGCGKTQLALQSAAELVDAFPDGVWLVDLAAVQESHLVPYQVAAACGRRGRARQTIEESLVTSLGVGQQLLVLDNCEHVIDACASLAQRVLDACPRLRLLATSRERLRVAGETTWRVPLLATPDPKPGLTSIGDLRAYPAVRLFVERAQAADAAFAMGPANAPLIAAICARLDGLPLAIELAAARVSALSLTQILEHLEDSVRLLVGGYRGGPARQQALRAALDWSWGLLSPAEQVVFRRLAMFAGGWSLEAAEAVCASDKVERRHVLELLTQLIDKSLVVATVRHERSHYRLLEPVRQYAWAQLAASDELALVQEHHALFFLSFAEALERDANVGGAGRMAAVEALEREYPNLQLALRWALDMGEPDVGLRVARAVRFLWMFQRPLGEGYLWVQELLGIARGNASTPAWALLLLTAARLAGGLGDHEAAGSYYQEATPLARRLGDSWVLVVALVDEGISAGNVGDYARARRRWAEGLLVARGSGDRASEAILLFNLGALALYDGEEAMGRELCEQARCVANDVDDAWVVSSALEILALAALVQNEPSSACTLAEACLSRHPDALATMGAMSTLADVDMLEGRDHDAQLHLLEALRVVRDNEDLYSMPRLVETLAHLCARLGQPEVALRIMASVEAAGGAYWCGRPAELVLRDRWLEPLRQGLPSATADRWLANGRALPLDRAVELAEGALRTPASWLSAAGPPEAKPHPLTTRQQEVAALVAQGLTNRQIGERLVVTEAAAAKHVEHILDKLGFGTRAQIAAWVAERGLVTTHNA